MWLLHLLPDSVIQWLVTCALFFGFCGIMIGFFLGNLPLIRTYKLPIQIVSIIVFCSGIYWFGGYTTERIWRKQVEELQAQVQKSEEKAPVITKQIVTKYKDKIVIVGRQVDVIKKEIEVKREIINEGCKLNPTAVEVYNRGIVGATVEVGPIQPVEEKK